jgi:RNA polymerase sigma-70 factor (ECF subfamily)
VSSSTDYELVHRLQQRDEAALVCTYEQYSARLLGFLLRLTNDRVLAEDLFQDTWCRLASSAGTLRPDTDLFAWLLAVARNSYFDDARRRAKLSPLPSTEMSGDSDFMSCTHVPDEQSSDREQVRVLERALRALSDLDREVLLLVAVEDLSHPCAARVLGIGEVAFRKRLSRARERLQVAMQQLTAVTPQTKGANGG